MIKDAFAARGVSVKVVILMREPLSRVKSSVSFILQNRVLRQGGKVDQAMYSAALGEHYQTEKCQVRTCYHRILREAREVFAPEDIYVGFYENMFSAEAIVDLSTFIGIRASPKFGAVYVNKTEVGVSVTKYDEAIREFYAEVYDFCYREYPVAKSLWDKSSH